MELLDNNFGNQHTFIYKINKFNSPILNEYVRDYYNNKNEIICIERENGCIIILNYEYFFEDISLRLDDYIYILKGQKYYYQDSFFYIIDEFNIKIINYLLFKNNISCQTNIELFFTIQHDNIKKIIQNYPHCHYSRIKPELGDILYVFKHKQDHINFTNKNDSFNNHSLYDALIDIQAINNPRNFVLPEVPPQFPEINNKMEL